MAIYRLGELEPRIANRAWVAESAEVIGNVTLADDSSVWYGCVVRGDGDAIAIGRASNIQDGSVLHTDPGFPVTVGERVTVGHKAMLHGCTIGDATLIGIGSVILNGARIGARSIVGAGALVTSGKTFPDGVLIVGAPARVQRELSADEIAANEASAAGYVRQQRRHRSERVRSER